MRQGLRKLEEQFQTGDAIMNFWLNYWWLVIPGMLLGPYAQIKLSSIYGKYIRIGTASGITGAQAAREALDNAGLTSTPVQQVAGHLTHHYHPLKQALPPPSANHHR